jgi:NAD-dependent dihydropyrimidine dehydrogenase PreA subunit
MAFVVTDACTKDFICASECATYAIHPTADEPAASTASQVYINPDECIDCGNCVSVCPSGAIFSSDELPADKAEFAAKNAAWFN